MILTALFIGLSFGGVGAIHCLGMCGPLVFALPFGGYPFAQKTLYSLAYHLARVAVYVALGMILFAFGNALWLSGFFNIFSVALGSLIIVYQVFSLFYSKKRRWAPQWQRLVSQGISKRLRSKGRPLLTFLVLGVLNGLLPCGLIYTTLNMSFLYHTPGEVMALMAGFGLATVPLLAILRVVPFRLPRFLSSKWSYIQKAILIIIAGLLIARGLNIKIPLLDPDAPVQDIHCH